MNLYLSDYLRKDPSLVNPLHRTTVEEFRINSGQITIEKTPFEELTEEERTRIRDIRLGDLEKFQTTSLLALIPFALLSFVLGYLVSGQFLEPLVSLKKEFDLSRADLLGKQIPIQSNDEIGSLIESFNNLSLRLKDSFDSQTLFVQDASHELRTPLTVIQTNLDTVLDDKKASREEMILAIQNALKGIDNLRKLSDSLLDLSLPVKIKTEKVLVNDFVETQVELLKEFSSKNSVSLKFSPSKVNYSISVDKILFARAISNLIENAIKYSKEVEKPEVVVSILQVKNKLQIIIHDNGIGIPENLQTKVFERFYRVDKSRNRRSGGFGLGLAIVKSILVNHGFSISVKSVPGDTSFIISI
jgi:two-component system sensor histidine kinase ArlS